MALKIAFYQSVWPQTLLSRKKKRLNTKNEDTSKTHGMLFDTCFGKSSESEPFWIRFFFSFRGGRDAISCNCLKLCLLQSLAPRFTGLFFSPSKPWMFYWKYAYIFFPYTTIQNGTITFVNNTMDAKPHITHFPPSPKTFRDATLSPSPVFPAPTCHHYRLWE